MTGVGAPLTCQVLSFFSSRATREMGDDGGMSYTPSPIRERYVPPPETRFSRILRRSSRRATRMMRSSIWSEDIGSSRSSLVLELAVDGLNCPRHTSVEGVPLGPDSSRPGLRSVGCCFQSDCEVPRKAYPEYSNASASLGAPTPRCSSMRRIRRSSSSLVISAEAPAASDRSPAVLVVSGRPRKPLRRRLRVLAPRDRSPSARQSHPVVDFPLLVVFNHECHGIGSVQGRPSRVPTRATR
jgi:hypothetical protein